MKTMSTRLTMVLVFCIGCSKTISSTSSSGSGKTVSLENASLSITEGSSATINVNLDKASDSDTIVNVTLTGTSGRFQSLPSTLTIPAQSTKASLTLQTINDSVYQGTQSFTLTITSRESGVTLGTSSLAITLLDDEVAGYTCGATAITGKGNVLNSGGNDGQTVYVKGNYAYMGTTGATATGIQIVNISDPTSPTNVAFISTQTGAGQIDSSANDVLGIYVDDTYLYAATYSGGLLIANITNPAAPTITSTLNLTGETWSVVRNGNYVYVGSPTNGLYVVDVTNPASPSLSATLTTVYPRFMQIVGTKIYGSADTKVFALDISTASSPTLLGDLTIGQYGAYQTYTSGNYLYAVDKANYIVRTYNISNPAKITLANSTTAYGTNDFRTITGYGSKVYVGTGAGIAGEVVTFDISTPSAPTKESSTYTLINRSYGLVFSQGFVYSADKGGKMEIAKICTN